MKLSNVEELIAIASELKTAVALHNYSSVSGLIERWQTLANRMEAGLMDKHDAAHYQDKIRSLRKEIKELEAKRDALEDE